MEWVLCEWVSGDLGRVKFCGVLKVRSRSGLVGLQRLAWRRLGIFLAVYAIVQALAGLAEPERMHSSSYGTRGGSSSRRAVVSSSRPSGSTEAVESSRTMSSSKIGPTSLRTSGGMQRSSPVASSEPKRMVPSRHPQPNLRIYEAALKGVESLSVEVDGSHIK